VVQFVTSYGIWFVAVMIALESIGVPLPAEAALMAAAFFAAQHNLEVWPLIAAGIAAAIAGEIVGFWIGKKVGRQLLIKHGPRIGMTEERMLVSQWLFVQYGSGFVFVARFLPFLRNIAAVSAGANSMAQSRFYFSSCAAAIIWVACYGLGSYCCSEAFTNLTSPAKILPAFGAALVVLMVPLLILRYEKRLLAKAISTR
jgi:membrane protein DedA with SNARE-associated domain